MALKYVQTNTFYQAGSGSAIGATSIVLTSFTDIYGNVLTMTDFGSKGYITLEPDTTNEESATFTGVTANTNGTYSLTGVSTALAKSLYTETSGLVRQHSGGTKVVVSDTTAFWNTFPNKQNDEALVGRWTTPVAPLNPNDIVNKTYADGLAIAGSPNASTTVKGIGEVSVAPVSPTTPIFVGDNDGRVPTQGENDALVGNNTDIAVGTGNKFVTQTGLIHNAEKYAADAGSNDTYVITLSPVPTSYTNGMVVYFKANTANTGAATINVNSLGAKTIVKSVNTTLVDNDIAAGMFCTVIYDGTNFVLQNPVANAPGPIPIFKNGAGQHIGGTGTFTIAHGLGKVPTFFSITALNALNSGNSMVAGSYNGTTQSSVYHYWIQSGSHNGIGTDSTHILFQTDDGTGGTQLSYTASWDATNVTFTAVVDSSFTFQYAWSAQA